MASWGCAPHTPAAGCWWTMRQQLCAIGRANLIFVIWGRAIGSWSFLEEVLGKKVRGFLCGCSCSVIPQGKVASVSQPSGAVRNALVFWQGRDHSVQGSDFHFHFTRGVSFLANSCERWRLEVTWNNINLRGFYKQKAWYDSMFISISSFFISPKPWV